jgi:hypothetical protein
VTGSAGSAVAAEGRVLEELFAVRYMSGTCSRALSGTKNSHQTNQACTTEQYSFHFVFRVSLDVSQWGVRNQFTNVHSSIDELIEAL